MNELVSIILPSCNDGDYLFEAIDSILSQTYNNIELIVIDSSDNYMDLKKRVTKLDQRIQYYYREKNGVADALNYGISRATGDYIARMDADDISDIRRIEKQVTFLEKHSDIDVVGACFNKIDGKGTFIERRILPETNEEIQMNLVFENPICHPTIMFRRKLIGTGTLYANVFAEDYELWTRLILNHKFAIIQEELLKYRTYGGNVSLTQRHKVHESDCTSTKKYISQLFEIELNNYEEHDFVKNYYLIHASKEEIGDYSTFLKKQIQLLETLYIAVEKLGAKRKEYFLDELWKRWRCLLTASNMLFTPKWLTEKAFFKGNFNEIYKHVCEVIDENSRLIEKMKAENLTVGLYGYGERGRITLKKFVTILKEHGLKWKLQYIVDQKEQTYEYEGKIHRTITAEEIEIFKVDYILISTHVYFEEVKQKLVKLGISEEKIIRDNFIYYI